MDAAVDIRPTYNPLGFAAAAAPIRAHVAGQGPFRLEWNQVLRVPVPPGEVMVVIWSAWLTKKFMGTSHALLQIEHGQQVGLEWKMPQTVFGKGKLTAAPLGPAVRLAGLDASDVPPDPGPRQLSAPHPTEPLAAMAATAPTGGAWHPDPTGRHPYRWWDGDRWTESASDGAATFSDPVPGL